VPFHNLSRLHAAIVEARGEQPMIATYFGHAAHELRTIFASKPQEPTAKPAA